MTASAVMKVARIRALDPLCVLTKRLAFNSGQDLVGNRRTKMVGPYSRKYGPRTHARKEKVTSFVSKAILANVALITRVKCAKSDIRNDQAL